VATHYRASRSLPTSERTSFGAADILLFNDVAVLYKTVEDLIFVVTGSQDENEVILSTVLMALTESINILLR
jgi:coatomer subunit zeta